MKSLFTKIRRSKKHQRVLKNPLFFPINTCKFCYGYSHGGERLYSMCNCDGSLKWCHSECLHEWIKYKYNDKRNCDICLSPYVIPDF